MQTIDAPEEWRKVTDWDYEVSSEGRVRRINPYRPNQAVILKQKTDCDGYRAVSLSRNRRYRHVKVSVLICEVFHGAKPTPEHQAAHWDGNKANNNESNIRWATRLDNDADGTRLGEHWEPKGELHPMHVLTEDDVREMRRRYLSGKIIREICDEMKVKRLTAYDAVQRGLTLSIHQGLAY